MQDLRVLYRASLNELSSYGGQLHSYFFGSFKRPIMYPINRYNIISYGDI